MYRREFVTALVAMNCVRTVFGSPEFQGVKFGMCTFSCHRHWAALRSQNTLAKTKFNNASTYYAYTRSLGGQGVQTGLADMNDEQIAEFRRSVEATDGYFESDIRMPTDEAELSSFERDIQRSKAAGATVARACLTGQRRYETWTSRGEFEDFFSLAQRRLTWVEPILRRNQFYLAIENHKDLTAIELVGLLKSIESEWIGINVDTGNNIALMEDPYETIERLAPWAKAVHFKDMAVQPHARGFLLSEVPCGTGCLDLMRIARTLRAANPQLHFSLEMATRDPLVIPCNQDAYWSTFPERKANQLGRTMHFVQSNPIKKAPPSIRNKSVEEQLMDEEKNNSDSLDWLNQHVRTLA
jgi:sugar phosphate isomerase/epimerase